MKIIRNISEYIKLRPDVTEVVVLVSGVFLSYGLLSELMYYLFPVIRDDINFFTDILFLSLTIIGIIYYSFTMKYYIDLDKYSEIIKFIRFDNTRVGTDALCCFLSFKDKGIPFKRKKDKILVRAALTQNPDPKDTLEDVIDKYQFKMYGYGKSCEKLGMNFNIKENDLILSFSCNVYENLPKTCRDYPSETEGICRLSEFCSSPCKQVDYFKWSLLYLYAFDEKKYPDMKKYSIGTAQNILRRYYLIPVPFRHGNTGIYCK